MAKLRFKKPKIAVLMSEVVSLTIWLYLGDQVIDVLDQLVGGDYAINVTDGASYPGDTTFGGCTNGTVFEDAYELLGIGYDCDLYVADSGQDSNTFANTADGLLGVIGLVMVVMILMNFISYN